MLEIARQSVPDGYGNSYFWVKPPRIVPGRPGAHRRRPARLHRRRGPARSTRTAPRAAARWFRDRGIATLGVCFLHSYANPDHERADARGPAPRSTPTRSSRISSEVLREYREYERVDDHAGRRGGQAQASAATSRNIARPAATTSPATGDPVLRHEVQRRRAVGRRGRAPADHHRALRPGGRRAGRRADRRASPASTGCSPATAAAPRPTSRVVVDGEPTLTTEGSVGAYPSKIPMIDVVTVGAGGGSIAWLSPEGTLKVGPAVGRRRPRARSATPRAAPSRPITDAHVVLGRIPPHLLGGEIPLDVDAARGRRRASSARQLGLAPGARAPPASSRSPRGTRPTRCARSRSSAASTSATSR